MMIKLPVKFNKAFIADALFISSVTIGIILLLGGVFIIILSSSMPAKASGVDSMVQTIALTINLVPGVPLSFTDLTGGGFIMIGIVSWITGLNILLVGLGLFVKSTLAKWVALGTFALATIIDFIQFLIYGVLGSPDAVLGILINGILVYLLTKTDF